jgi:hypothetical protein
MGVRCFKPGKSRVAGTPSRVRTVLAWFATLTPLLALGGCTGMVSGQNKSAASALQVTPAAVDFGSAGVGKTVSQIATVENTGTTTVTLTKASVSTKEFSISGLQFPISIQAGQRARFTVSFKGSKPGRIKGKLHFTGDPTDPDPVDLTGSAGNSAPKLEISAASHDFGKVTVNTVANATLTLTNSGAGNLNISQITATGTVFSVTGVSVPAVVPAGGTVTVNVAFSPKTAGNDTGTVAIASDDPTTPNATVSLTGVGTAVDVGKLTATPASLSFSNVKVGSSATAVTTLKNTGTANLTLSQISTSTPVYSTSGVSVPVVMAPGDSVALTVKFTPTAAGTKGDSVSLVNSQGGITSVSLSGTALAVQSSLTVSPGNISFGNVVTNLTNSQTVQLTNPSTISVKVSTANITGTGFSTSGLNLPLTLNAGQSSTFNMQFNPKTAGSSSGTLTLVSDATTSPAPITLSGTGIAAGLTLSVNPSSLSFGNVNVSATASKNVTVTNTGNSSVAISSVTLTGAQFTLTGGSAVTLTPSQSITLTVQFAPTVAGAASGTLSVVSNATGSPASIAVSGSGVAAPVQHTVALSWNASSSAVGYNVYRSGISGGGYSKINSSLDGGLSYTDATVQNSHSYFYVTTAVDNAGNESAFSLEVSANIP